MNYTDNNYEDLNIDQITEKVFSQPVKPPRSIQLFFDNVSLKHIFESLLTFTVNGMKYKFSRDGTTVNIENLTEENVEEIKGYVNSIGFNLIINTYTQDEFNNNIFPWFVQFNNMPYDKNETDLTKYQFLITKINYYIISFSFIQ